MESSKTQPGHPMVNADFEALTGQRRAEPESLGEFAARLDRTRAQCAVMRRLVMYVAECGADRHARSAIDAVIRHFDTATAARQVELDEALFPALMEAMAGSDAVCLREQASGLSDDHRAISRAWQRLRPAFEAVAAGTQDVLPAQETEAFVLRCESVIEFKQGELLPMARRLLLDDAQLASLGLSLNAR